MLWLLYSNASVPDDAVYDPLPVSRTIRCQRLTSWTIVRGMVVHAVYSPWRGQVIDILFPIFCSWLRTIRHRRWRVRSVVFVCYLVASFFISTWLLCFIFHLHFSWNGESYKFGQHFPRQGEAALSSQRCRRSEQDRDEGVTRARMMAAGINLQQRQATEAEGSWQRRRCEESTEGGGG